MLIRGNAVRLTTPHQTSHRIASHRNSSYHICLITAGSTVHNYSYSLLLHILTCSVLSCLVLSCLVLSCLVLSCLVLSCLVLSYHAYPSPRFTSPVLFDSCSMDPQCVAVTEEYAAGIVHECDEKLRKSFSVSCHTPGGDELSESVMKKRKRLLDRELLGMEIMRVEKAEVRDLEGRISGDIEWKLSRGEIGKPSTATHGAAGVKGEGGLEGTVGGKEGEEEAEVEDDGCLVLQYMCLGGKVHDDTVAFDSTHCLWSLLQLLYEELESTTPASPTATASATATTASPTATATAISQDSGTGKGEEHSSIKGNNKDEDKNKETEKGAEIKVDAGVHAPSNDKEEAHGEDVRGVIATPLQCLSFPSSSVSAVAENAHIRISQYQDLEDKHFHRPGALRPRPVTTRTLLTPSQRSTWASLLVTDITVFAGTSISNHTALVMK